MSGSHWHFLQVTDWPPELKDEDGYEYDLAHPEACGWRIEIDEHGTQIERLCGINHEIDNVGSQADVFGDPSPGWYAVRYWSETRPYSDSVWAEVTTGVEVLSLIDFAARGGVS